MCRNIRNLYNFKPPATDEEIHASSLQFVRKLSGFNRPSKANEEAFNRAVAEVAHAARHLIDVAGHDGAAARPRGRGREGARPLGAALRPPVTRALRCGARRRPHPAIPRRRRTPTRPFSPSSCVSSTSRASGSS